MVLGSHIGFDKIAKNDLILTNITIYMHSDYFKCMSHHFIKLQNDLFKISKKFGRYDFYFN